MKWDGVSFTDEFESTLTLMTKDEFGGVLGQAWLDLSKFDDLGEDTYNTHRIPFFVPDTDQEIEDSWVEVGLKAVANKPNDSKDMSKSNMSASGVNSSIDKSKSVVSNTSPGEKNRSPNKSKSFVSTPKSLVANDSTTNVDPQQTPEEIEEFERQCRELTLQINDQ